VAAPAPEAAPAAPAPAPAPAAGPPPAPEAPAPPQPAVRPAPIVLPARPAGLSAPVPPPAPAPVLGPVAQSSAVAAIPAPAELPRGGANLWIPPLAGLVLLSAGTMLRRWGWLQARGVRLLGAVEAQALSLALVVCGAGMIVSPVVWIGYTGRTVNATQARALASWEQAGSFAAVPVGTVPAQQTSPSARMVLTIPSLGLRRYVPEDSTPDYLRRYGVGWIPWTALPDGEGVVGIAGHRTTYGAPFFRLDVLEVGDVVHLDYGGQRYTYRVERFATVRPTQVEVLQGSRTIALVTCTPAYSAASRLVVLGSLETVAGLGKTQ